QRVLQELILAVLGPGPGKLMLVKDAELHVIAPSGRGCSGPYRIGGSGLRVRAPAPPAVIPPAPPRPAPRPRRRPRPPGYRRWSRRSEPVRESPSSSIRASGSDPPRPPAPPHWPRSGRRCPGSRISLLSGSFDFHRFPLTAGAWIGRPLRAQMMDG